jgi:hypothetical protein
MQAARGEIIDEVEGDEVSLYFPVLEGVLAEGALLADQCPILDADIAVGVSV